MESLCISCNERPVKIKKWRRCMRCYNQLTRTAGFNPNKNHGILKQRTEMDFIKNFFDHKNWIFHPVIFRLNKYSYEPDFYDGKRHVFIEVAGTRQAFCNNREKYKEFTKTFPKINFEIRQVNGDLIDLYAEKQHITKNLKK